MSRISAVPSHQSASFPRVSGDEPLGQARLGYPRVFSPRERG